MARPFTTLDPYKRDQMVAYLNANKDRIKVVKTFERRAEPLTTAYFDKLLWNLNKEDVLVLLKDMEQHGVIQCLTYSGNNPETWDLTLEGKESLYAIGIPPHASEWHLPNIIGGITTKLGKLFGKSDKSKT